jgi:hypothetical protein
MKKLLLIITAIALMAAPAMADVLWDQGTPDPSYSAFDSESGCGGFMGQATVHLASDINVPVTSNITSISTMYGVHSPGFQGVTQAYLYIGLKTSALPVDGVDAPHDASYLVSVSAAYFDPGDGGQWYFELTASGLDITLTPGDYWVSLTPIYFAGPEGPVFHFKSTTNWGDDSASMEYCGMFDASWFPTSAGRDMTLHIEGTTEPVAVEPMVWGNMKALYR